jgi:ribosome-binding factor A
MAGRRLLKAAEAIREVVSMAILTEMRDPRVRDVTVVQVEVAPDMKQAKIHVSIMGDERKQKLGLLGLQNAAGFLQHKIAEEIDTRYTPRLTFVLDKGVKNSLEIARILSKVLPPNSPPDSTAQSEVSTARSEAGAQQAAEDEPDENEPAEDAHDSAERADGPV